MTETEVSRQKWSIALKWTIFTFPLIVITGFVWLKLSYKDIYSGLIQEDSSIEYLQVLLYMAAAIASFFNARYFYVKRDLALASIHCLFFLVLLFVSLEELSWGQRIIGFQGPDVIINSNKQHEFTIHNLRRVQRYLHKAYILVGFLGAFSDLIIVKIIGLEKRLAIKSLAPDRMLIFYFLPTFLIYLYLQYADKVLVRSLGFQDCEIGRHIVFRDQEPAELLLSLGFLLWTLMMKKRHAGQQTPCTR